MINLGVESSKKWVSNCCCIREIVPVALFAQSLVIALSFLGIVAFTRRDNEEQL